MRVPAIVIAAPASGAGKTTVATGLIGALRHAGHEVAPFKVGPDYIDPGYHAVAAGRAGRNLDPVLVGADQIRPLYQHGAAGAGIAVIEGVMGLFDGRIAESPAAGVAAGSTAQVATLLGAPVIMVIDARGHSQSLAAVLHGFTSFDPAVRIGGVILNRVGSARHEQVLRAACGQVGLPVLGVLPRVSALSVPERHLGLVPAAEQARPAADAVAAMTALAATHIDLAAVAALAVPVAAGTPWDPAAALLDGSPPEPGPQVVGPSAGKDPLVVAYASGPAFTFGYAEHAELLAAAGAQVVTFDPLRDELPPGTSALVIPGGFPEVHAARLTANTVLREQVLRLAQRGMPVHAECAGLLYLSRTLDGHDMTGVLPFEAAFTSELTLGYRDAAALTSSALWTAGQRVIGHEFHRTAVTAAPVAGRASAGLDSATGPAWGWRAPGGGTPVREGAVYGQVHASYLHTHPAGHPGAIRRFAAAATNFAAAGLAHD